MNYLIPIGADIQAENEVEFEGIDANLVLRKMESATNRVNLVFLDACRDNPFARRFRSTAGGLAIVDAPTGSLVVYATAPGSLASDGQGRNGVFTNALLKHIHVENMDVEIMLKLVREDVSIATGGEQIPWSSSSLIGRFLFAGGNQMAVPVAASTKDDAIADSVVAPAIKDDAFADTLVTPAIVEVSVKNNLGVRTFVGVVATAAAIMGVILGVYEFFFSH